MLFLSCLSHLSKDIRLQSRCVECLWTGCCSPKKKPLHSPEICISTDKIPRMPAALPASGHKQLCMTSLPRADMLHASLTHPAERQRCVMSRGTAARQEVALMGTTPKGLEKKNNYGHSLQALAQGRSE